MAAHVTHVDFYLEVIERYVRTGDNSNIDWRAIWDTVREVTPSEWEALRAKLRASYARVRLLLEGIEDWNQERRITDAVAIIAHSASHLGAIRQGLRTIGHEEP